MAGNAPVVYFFPIYVVFYRGPRGKETITIWQVFWLPDKTLNLLFASSHPDKRDNDKIRISFPITAAGPRPILTDFPFQSKLQPLLTFNNFYRGSKDSTDYLHIDILLEKSVLDTKIEYMIYFVKRTGARRVPLALNATSS